VWASGDAGAPNGWKTYDLTDLVQGWVDGDFDNYGIICKGYGSGYYQRWYSRESGTKPYLDIDYTVVEPDTDPPYVDGMEPGDGESDVPVGANIVFHAKDDDKGVDVSTIAFTAEDSSLSGGRALSLYAPTGSISGDLDIDDADINDVVCVFTPDEDLPYEDEITCTVDGSLADVKGNEMGDDFVWSFTTEEEPPNVTRTTWGAIKAEY